KVEGLLSRFHTLNPHAHFILKYPPDGERHFWATDRDLKKWRSKAQTSAHWYTEAGLTNLIRRLCNDGCGKETLRDFISRFDGLTAKQLQREVIERASVDANTIAELSDTQIDVLLNRMQTVAKPVNASLLATVGKSNLRNLAAFYKLDSFKYKRLIHETEDGLPFIVEVAFGVKNTDIAGAEFHFGLNFSPTLECPFEDRLINAWTKTTDDDPVILFIHLICPKFVFLESGKGKINLDTEMRGALYTALDSVTKVFQ